MSQGRRFSNWVVVLPTLGDAPMVRIPLLSRMVGRELTLWEMFPP